MKKILLVSDLDHTLLDDCTQVSQENLSAIATHVASGGKFTVATGRAVAAIRIFPELLPYINLPIITGNGGQIYDLHRDELLYSRTLPHEAEPLLYALMEQFPLVGVAAYHGQNGFYSLRTNANIEDLIRREGRPATHCSPQESPKPWNKILLTMDHSYLMQVEQTLASKLGEAARMVYSETSFLELLPIGVSKGAALQIILDREHIHPDQVVAIGDAFNDLEMLQLAGLGVAVENALPELKKMVDTVVCSNSDHAIRFCLEHFF